MRNIVCKTISNNIKLLEKPEIEDLMMVLRGQLVLYGEDEANLSDTTLSIESMHIPVMHS